MYHSSEPVSTRMRYSMIGHIVTERATRYSFCQNRPFPINQSRRNKFQELTRSATRKNFESEKYHTEIKETLNLERMIELGTRSLAWRPNMNPYHSLRVSARSSRVRTLFRSMVLMLLNIIKHLLRGVYLRNSAIRSCPWQAQRRFKTNRGADTMHINMT